MIGWYNDCTNKSINQDEPHITQTAGLKPGCQCSNEVMNNGIIKFKFKFWNLVFVTITVKGKFK